MRGVRKVRAVAEVVVAGALVLAAHAPISAAQVGTTHLDVFAVEGPFEKDIDLGKPGFPSAGDYAVESQPILDPSDGSSLGRSLTELTIIRPMSHGQDLEIVLDSTLRLPDGDLVVDGGLRFSDLFADGEIAVVGGTRAFAGARGTATFAAGTVDGKDGFFLSIDVVTG